MRHSRRTSKGIYNGHCGCIVAATAIHQITKVGGVSTPMASKCFCASFGGASIEPSKLTVSEFLHKWSRDYAETNVSPKTLERYCSIINQHLVPAFGSLPLAKLQPLHIQAHYSSLLKGGRKDGREGGLSAQSILHHHRLLHAALKMAVRWHLVVRNPADAVEPPKVRKSEVKAIDESACAWLLDAAIGTRLHIPVLIAISAGLRRGEILAAGWSDLDWTLGGSR
jgi:integrase